MTSLLSRKRFFGQDNNELPLTTNGSHGAASPPSSAVNLFSMDYDRIVPGRASSMSIVRQRSGQSLSPTAGRPRKALSMFFPNTSTTSGCNSDSSIDYSSSYSLHQHLQSMGINGSGHNTTTNHNPNAYGMLNPGPLLKPRSHSGIHPQDWIPTVTGIIGFMTLLALAVSTYENNTHLNRELHFKDQEIQMHLEHANRLESRVNTLRTETILLHNRIEELEHPEPTQEELNIQRQLFHLEHHQEQLHRGIAQQSKRLVLEKFGAGPKYYVEMKLAFDPESNIVQDATTEIEDTIWIETAHIDEMPHTIHFFLEQVANGVFDNTEFYWNAPTFIQAGPDHDPHKLQVLERTQPSLVHLIYQEHSQRLNHQQYTLGFPGRPGGPDFYLNLEDNSGEHGHSNLHSDADPCFARIVRGFNTMERIHRSRVWEDDGVFRRKQYRIVHPVTIVSMTVQHTDHAYGESPATPQRR